MQVPIFFEVCGQITNGETADHQLSAKGLNPYFIVFAQSKTTNSVTTDHSESLFLNYSENLS
jgi:hypothetical protein